MKDKIKNLFGFIGRAWRGGVRGKFGVFFAAFALLAFIEQEPVRNIQNGKHDVETKATNSPVRLRIATFRACKHNVKYEEGEQDAEYADKLQKRSGCHEAVFLLLNRLYQRSHHNTKAKEIANVGKVYVEIPTDCFNIIKNPKASNTTDKP